MSNIKILQSIYKIRIFCIILFPLEDSLKIEQGKNEAEQDKRDTTTNKGGKIDTEKLTKFAKLYSRLEH